eukprot:142428-Chlamydomonas_euryale.AAC.5
MPEVHARFRDVLLGHVLVLGSNAPHLTVRHKSDAGGSGCSFAIPPQTQRVTRVQRSRREPPAAARDPPQAMPRIHKR